MVSFENVFEAAKAYFIFSKRPRESSSITEAHTTKNRHRHTKSRSSKLTILDTCVFQGLLKPARELDRGHIGCLDLMNQGLIQIEHSVLEQKGYERSSTIYNDSYMSLGKSTAVVMMQARR